MSRGEEVNRDTMACATAPEVASLATVGKRLPTAKRAAYSTDRLQVFNQPIEGGGIPLCGQLMGASVITALPVVILYMVFQRYLLSGLTAGGVKG